MGDRPLAEIELVALAQSGDSAAYQTLVEEHQTIAFRTAYLITGSAAEAEDAVQEGFVKAFYALGRFRPDAPFRPWVLRIVANEARNLRRSAGRRSSLELAMASEPEELAPSPEQEAVSRERREALLRAMDGLTEAEREVIALRYFLDLSEAEMGEVMAVARGTVKSRLSRALRRLRNAAVEAGVGRGGGW